MPSYRINSQPAHNAGRPTRPGTQQPPQPRDGDIRRSGQLAASYGFKKPSRPDPQAPWPRDPGNGRQFGNGGNEPHQPRDPGNGRLLILGGGDGDPESHHPRDPGSRRRMIYLPQPRDSGMCSIRARAFIRSQRSCSPQLFAFVF